MSDTPPRRDLARLLGDLAIEMQTQLDTESVLRTIAVGATAIVPGVRWAGISLLQGRKVEARVPSDPIVMKLDDLQSELGEGPCITTIREQQTVHVEDMAQPNDWPQFAEAALALGVHCSLTFRLFVREGTIGALNLYGGEAGVLAGDSLLYGEILAQHASVAMAGSQAADQFKRALASRDIIGQAKGVIMQEFRIGDAQAFALLTRLSQESNMKLMDIAAELVRDAG
jgi:hypothetical protein